ncbi:MAG: hypothetical protein ABSF82_02035 [Candidatus Bathyarchaeia archaeon]|jgi:hypothetical protein
MKRIRLHHSKRPITLEELGRRVNAEQNLADKIEATVKPQIEAYLTALKYPKGMMSTTDSAEVRDILRRMERQVSPGHKLTFQDESRIARTVEAMSQTIVPFSDAEIDEQRKQISSLVFTMIRFAKENQRLQDLRKEQLELLETANRQLELITRGNALLISLGELESRLPAIVDSLHTSLPKFGKRLGVAS